MAQDSTRRRDFLKVAGCAALTIRGANDRVNVAFIGAGRMGARNIGYAAKVPGFQIVAVCDVRQPGADGFPQDSGGPLHRRGMHLHAGRLPRLHDGGSVPAGKDVYVETPAFVYVEEGVKMVEAARKYKRVVQAGTVERSSASVQRAREMVKGGALGEVRFCRAFEAAATDGACM